MSWRQMHNKTYSRKHGKYATPLSDMVKYGALCLRYDATCLKYGAPCH